MSIEINSVDVFKTLSAPLDVQIEVTSACNERCSHCYNFWRGAAAKAGSDYNSTIGKDQIAFIVNELQKANVFGVTFSGGEPLLFYETLREGIRLASEYGIKCTVNSNLTSLTYGQAKDLKEMGVDAMLTSIHSFDERDHEQITHKKGSFRQVLRGIRICEEVGLNVGVNMVVTRANKDQVIETGRYIKSLGVGYFSATRGGLLSNPQEGLNQIEFKKMLDDLLFLGEEESLTVDSLTSYPVCGLQDLGLYRRFINRSCAAGITSATIGADGNLRSCSFSDESYGSIFIEPLSQVWGRMRDWRDGSRLPQMCLEECEYFSMCRGGCRVEAKHSGDKRGMDPLATDPSRVIKPMGQEDYKSDDFQKIKLQFPPGIRMRREDFGGVIFSREGVTRLVDHTAYNTVSSLHRMSVPFSFEEIKDRYNFSEVSSNFFFSLTQAQILEIIR